MTRPERRTTVALLRAHFAGRAFHLQQAQAIGISHHQVRRAARAGDLRWVARSTYVVPDEPGAHLRAVIERLRGAGVRPVVGGRSAAQMWDIPVFGAQGPLPQALPTILVPKGSALRRGSGGGIFLREADVPAEHVIECDGLPLTSPLRTGVDLAKEFGRSRAATLVPLCGAVRAEVVRRTFPPGRPPALDPTAARVSSHHVTRAAREPSLRRSVQEDLTAVLGAVSRYGLRQARFLLPDVEPLLETPAESLAWAEITMSDLPRPVPQAQVRGDSGRLHRADFLVAGRVVIEVDGAIKYADQTVWQEKQRQSDLEAAGYWVVRCTWTQLLHQPERVVADIRRALVRSAPQDGR